MKLAFLPYHFGQLEYFLVIVIIQEWCVFRAGLIRLFLETFILGKDGIMASNDNVIKGCQQSPYSNVESIYLRIKQLQRKVN
jgi:hypothetical protein